jgi:hemoglobin
MAKFLLTGLYVLASSVVLASQETPTETEAELPVDPYEISNENAGAKPIVDPAVLAAFNGQEGVSRIVDDLVDRMLAHPDLKEITFAADHVRLRRTLKEQFCYILGGPCDYSGRDMASVHKDHGITTKEFNALVEELQKAMYAEGVPFRMQNKLLARLAPMYRDVVTR